MMWDVAKMITDIAYLFNGRIFWNCTLLRLISAIALYECVSIELLGVHGPGSVFESGAAHHGAFGWLAFGEAYGVKPFKVEMLSK